VSMVAGEEREQSGASGEHEEEKWERGALPLGADAGIRPPAHVGQW
jgi:hypothetical protein